MMQNLSKKNEVTIYDFLNRVMDKKFTISLSGQASMKSFHAL